MLKRVAVCGTALVLSCACRIGSAADVQGKTIALANCGAVPGDVMEQVREYVEKQLRVPVRSFEAKTVTATDLPGCVKQVAALKGDADVCVVGMPMS